MREELTEVGVYFAKRKAKKRRVYFLSFLIKKLREYGRNPEQIRGDSKLVRAVHVSVGNLENAKKVIVSAYDTGSKMLIPNYKYTPLNKKRNIRLEFVNSLIYMMISLCFLAFIIYITKGFADRSLLYKVLIVIADGIFLIMSVIIAKNPDNKINMNHNSAAVAVMYSMLEKISVKINAFVFLDQSLVLYKGYEQVSKMLENNNPEVIILDSIGRGESIYLVFRENNKENAEAFAELFDFPIEMRAIDDNKALNSSIGFFENAMLLTSGKENNNEIVVENIRTKKDTFVDVKRLEKIRKVLIKYVKE